MITIHPIALSMRAAGLQARDLPPPTAAHPYIGTDEHKLATDGTQIRAWLRRRLHMGIWRLELAPSADAIDNVIVGLRVSKLYAEANGLDTTVRIIDGCEGPLQAIKRRIDAGTPAARALELLTLQSAAHHLDELLPEIPDADLVCAYVLDQELRSKAQETQQ